MNLENFPYRAIFASHLVPLVSEDKDKYLAKASLENVRKYIPNLPENSIDLLPWAAQGFNINRANKNDDGINTEIALSMYKDFKMKYLDVEHKRQNIVGVILEASLAEFGSNKILTEEDIKKLDNEKPFNVVLGGVIWKIVSPKLADLIEESNDKDSDKYMSFSLSWELGFKEFDVAILKDESPNLEGAEIITGKEVDDLKQYLKAFGGSGVYKDKRIIRMPTGKIVSLGAAITEKPAAYVKGIATASEKNILENKNNISHSSKSCVNKNNDIMKLNSLEDITDENLKQISASVITDFIKKEITTQAQKWEQEKNAKESQLSEAKQSAEKTLQELQSIKQSLAELNKEREDRVKTDAFNSRMNKIDASFNLEDDVRATLVEEVKSIASDEDFNKWENRIGVILKAYKKSKTKKDSNDKDSDDMVAKKDKKVKAEASTNEIGEDNKGPGEGDNSNLKGPDVDSDNQFVNRDGKNVNPTDGENNGEHPNQIAKDNWNKNTNKSGSGKPTNDDSGLNAGASVIENAIDNADKINQHIINTSESKPLTMKEKFAQIFASSVIVNGKQLNTK